MHNPDPPQYPLDLQLQQLLPKITNHTYLKHELSKHMKIRINGWISRLQSIVSNNIWRKNRNNYAKLLFVMFQCKDIIQPFLCMAPEDVPTLQRHHINCILMKLVTRGKQKQRDNKENKELRLPNPLQLWNQLQQKQFHSTQPPSTKNLAMPTTPNHVYPHLKQTVLPKQSLLLQIDQNLNQSQNKNKNGKTTFDSISMAIDYLSPISQGFHVRANSNLSDCTLHSLEKCRDLIGVVDGPQYVDWDCREERQQVEKSHKALLQQKVKYFRKNRHREEQNNSQIQKISSGQLTKKLTTFLHRHEQTLQGDPEYEQILNLLKQFQPLQFSCSGQSKSVIGISECSAIPIKDGSAYKQRLTECQIKEGTSSKKEEENFSLMEIDQNSYDYAAGKYSEYSSIELDSGISPSRIKAIDDCNAEDKFKRKNPLEQCKSTIVNEIPQTISTFRKGICIQQSRYRPTASPQTY